MPPFVREFTLMAPCTLTIPLPTDIAPAPLTEEPLCSKCVPPLKLSMVPLKVVNWPLLVPPALRLSTPVCACNNPELLHAMPTVLVPVPELLRSVPAFARTAFPEFRLNAVPSACRSKVALGALLKTGALLQIIDPAVQAAAPL